MKLVLKIFLNYLQVANDMQNRMEEISVEAKTDRFASIGTMREPLSTILEDSTVFASKPRKLELYHIKFLFYLILK